MGDPVKSYDDSDLMEGWHKITSYISDKMKKTKEDLGDQRVYGTKARKEAIEEAASDEPTGFKKASK